MGPDPPLFEGEPERCSLCGEPGHTHDDHWLFDHEPVKALQARLREAEDVAREAAKAAVTDAQYERLRFIREAVLWCRIDARDDATAWQQARALWDAKPEDC